MPYMRITGLVPTRFITIITHLIITITVFLSREAYITSSLPLPYSQDQYNDLDQQFLIGLGISMGMFAIELIGILGGLSLFMPTQSLISCTCHTAAVFAMLVFAFNVWPVSSYWYIFSFCLVVPAFTEIIAWIRVLSFKPGESSQEDTRGSK